VLPALNQADLAELPAEVRNDMQFVPAATLEDVLNVALPTEGRAATARQPM
jgi:ATP-dependent Lon protease